MLIATRNPSRRAVIASHAGSRSGSRIWCACSSRRSQVSWATSAASAWLSPSLRPARSTSCPNRLTRASHAAQSRFAARRRSSSSAGSSACSAAGWAAGLGRVMVGWGGDTVNPFGSDSQEHGVSSTVDSRVSRTAASLMPPQPAGASRSRCCSVTPRVVAASRPAYGPAGRRRNRAAVSRSRPPRSATGDRPRRHDEGESWKSPWCNTRRVRRVRSGGVVTWACIPGFPPSTIFPFTPPERYRHPQPVRVPDADVPAAVLARPRRAARGRLRPQPGRAARVGATDGRTVTVTVKPWRGPTARRSARTTSCSG